MNSSTEGSVWRRISGENMDQPFFSSDSTAAGRDSATTTDSKSNKKKKGHHHHRHRHHHHHHQSRNVKKKTYPLLKFEELPEYMKDNEYILDYYRVDWPVKEALFSIFRWHNETLNVWTHLIGFVLFMGLTVANLMEVPQVADFFGIFISPFPQSGADANVSHNSKNFFSGPTQLINFSQPATLEMEVALPGVKATRWPFFIFLGGSMFCLLSSSTCHLFACQSHHVNLMWLRMDYVGIAVMIITSFFPPIFYIFQCQPLWQAIYLTGVTVMGVFTIITLLTPAFSSGKFRSFRALLFVAMGLFGLVPAIHAIFLNWSEPRRNVTLAYETAMAIFYLVGTGFYVSRVPERLKPGWFDLAGHSHQIFHVFVIFGALAHYGAALVFLDFRSKVGCGKS